jgi:hypothetical protein
MSGHASTLSIKIAGGTSPNGHLVERKIRNWVFLSERSHIVLRGLRFEAGSLQLNGSGITLEHCEINHPCHFLAFPKGYSEDGDLPWGAAVIFQGSQNTIRDCIITDSAGSGVLVRGSGNIISRNLISNIDYSGTYAAGIALGGHGNTVEFNTIHDTGRDCIGITGGGHTIMYNDLSHAGRLALDGGMIYSYGQNGQDGSGRRNRIAYNWVHDCGNPEDPLSSGIYLDNYSRNFTVDHNVVWNLGTNGKHKGVFFNSPGENLSAFHNTLIGCTCPESGTWCKFPEKNDDPSFWTTNNVGINYSFQNNLVIPLGQPVGELLVDAAEKNFLPKGLAVDPHSTNGVTEWFSPDGKVNVPAGYRLTMKDPSHGFKYHEITGNGVVIPGINDGFTGDSPDNGAYEQELAPWKPGRDGWPVP